MAYPNTIDTMQTVNSAQTLAQAGHSDRHNEVAATVNAIQTELGTNPSGAAATVVARFDALDTLVALKAPSASPTFTGVQSNAVGTAALPSITFTGDPDTGIYHPTANQVSISTNGVQALTVSSGGQVDVAGNLIAVGTVAGSGLAGSLLSSATPQALGTAASGTSTTPSRSDHVHSGTDVSLTTPTITGGSLSNSRLISPEEKWNIASSAITTTTTVDYLTAQNWYYLVGSTAGACTFNIRGDSGTTLSSILATNDSITFSFAVTTGATTPGYFNAVQVDGSSANVTVRWQYATTPTSGTTSGVDMYSFTIVKTAATPAYTVFASVAKW